MLDLHKIESDTLKFWENKKIYKKLKERNSQGKKFYFLQGPPYTSGKIHIGHAWNNSLKDVIMRYERMKGFDVWDRGGYDMHGLPTEHAVQKKLKLKTKEEIEKYGVEKFIKACMSFSNEHAGYMSQDLWNLGIWMDHDGSYKPIEKEFISGEWAFFKKANEQGRLYRGKKVMHWDAETETSLSRHELEYETVKEKSVFLKFKKKKTKNEYFIIWTTTPWTIPYNLAIMANPEVEYVKIKVENEFWIMAKALVQIFMNSVVEKKYEIVAKFLGKTLEGQEYEHFLNEDTGKVYTKLKKQWKKVHTIIMSTDYVDTTSGSGLVHCAPGCGPEDQEVGERYGIGTFNTLNERGEIEELGKYSGWVAKTDDDKFIQEFKNKNVLLATTEVEHEYPFSDRSHKPVIFRTTEQWFLKTKDLVPDLLKMNKQVRWVPKSVGINYTRWTENLRDNGVTRQRYWGCPVPIWVNKKNQEDYLVIGSVEELEKLTGKTLDDLSLHRPYIDNVEIKIKRKTYKRIPDVSDVWIDSGTASWNCLHNDPELMSKYFPADLVLEATEQTRLWFSLLQICSAVMFNKSCYENVFVHGMILDYQGTKMSKSLGNIISPYEVLEKFSADILRYYMCEVTAAENINFNWEDVKTKQRNLIILQNIASYIKDLEKQDPKKGKPGVEERWMLSKCHSAIKEVTELFEQYRLDETIKSIENLYIILSRDHIKYVRDKAGENSSVLETVKEVYLNILKMFSTICPFITDHLYRTLGQEEESVHLCKWPSYDEKKIDKSLEISFDFAMKIIEAGLAVRDKEKIGLRWPLSQASISCWFELSKDILEVIGKQLNVKKVELKVSEKKEISVSLDLKASPELEAEGYAREIARKVQAERKKAGLEKKDGIILTLCATPELIKILNTQMSFLKERTNASEILIVDKMPEKGAVFSTIKGNKVVFSFKLENI